LGGVVLNTPRISLLSTRVERNEGRGIWLLQSIQGVVDGNTLVGNGLVVDESAENQITNNVCRLDSASGSPCSFFLGPDTHDNEVCGNDLRECGADPAIADEGSNNLVEDNMLPP
jgi:parallel beta-helix repeat protein